MLPQRGAYFFWLGGSALSTTVERQSDYSTTKLVKLDCEVRGEAAVEVPPQKTTIRIEQSSGVTTDMNKKKRLLAKAHRDWKVPSMSSNYPY